MGITNCGRHKKSKSGAKRNKMQKKRKNMMGRQFSNTKIGPERIKDVRCRGGIIKKRALRINEGSFEFLSTGNKAQAKIEQVIYHPTSNELMRTNTMTKSAVIKINSENFAEEIKKMEKEDKVLQYMAKKGFLYAIVTSRPGQCGYIEGYILQGEELDFYQNKLKKGKIEV